MLLPNMYAYLIKNGGSSGHTPISKSKSSLSLNMHIFNSVTVTRKNKISTAKIKWFSSQHLTEILSLYLFPRIKNMGILQWWTSSETKENWLLKSEYSNTEIIVSGNGQNNTAVFLTTEVFFLVDSYISSKGGRDFYGLQLTWQI